jgi:ABC-type nitrate/sulfonate/bicarbonate transport system ATPase subunit
LLKDISFNSDSINFTTLLAPVGSGKSSLLKILAGLDKPTTGNIDTNLMKRVFIPSSPSSFPWLSVYDNIAFNSKLSNEQILEIINQVGLSGYENHFPHNKSEGFRFRISLGRALSNNPDMIIIDEPFDNLNTATRSEIYSMLRKIFINNSIPFILGTTNITEAILLSDEIYLMKKNPGEIIDKIAIELPRDRTPSIIDSDEFISVRTKIESVFKVRADRQLYNFSI